jgi:hypothetical protein
MRKFQTDESQQIKELHYNDDTRQMMVFFVNGSAYIYEGVSLATFGWIISAESIGTTFSEFTKTNPRYRKVK